MKFFKLILMIIIIFYGCSQSYNYSSRSSIPPKKYPIVENIDSNIVTATVKPADYRWNEEGNLIDIIRKKYKPPEPGYPNPFSPPTYIQSQPGMEFYQGIKFHQGKADSVKFYLCNENESSCYKFQEDYFENGSYSIGFQKLNMDTCIFVLKIETSDTIFSKKKIYMP